MTEKRRTPRYHVWLPVQLQFREQAPEHQATAVNLCADGAQLSASHPAGQAEPVLLQLQLSRGIQAVECKGRICWSRRAPDGTYSLGVRFVDITGEERDRIEEFLTETAAVTV